MHRQQPGPPSLLPQQPDTPQPHPPFPKEGETEARVGRAAPSPRTFPSGTRLYPWKLRTSGAPGPPLSPGARQQGLRQAWEHSRTYSVATTATHTSVRKSRTWKRNGRGFSRPGVGCREARAAPPSEEGGRAPGSAHGGGGGGAGVQRGAAAGSAGCRGLARFLQAAVAHAAPRCLRGPVAARLRPPRPPPPRFRAELSVSVPVSVPPQCRRGPPPPAPRPPSQRVLTSVFILGGEGLAGRPVGSRGGGGVTQRVGARTLHARTGSAAASGERGAGDPPGWGSPSGPPPQYPNARPDPPMPGSRPPPSLGPPHAPGPPTPCPPSCRGAPRVPPSPVPAPLTAPGAPAAVPFPGPQGRRRVPHPGRAAPGWVWRGGAGQGGAERSRAGTAGTGTAPARPGSSGDAPGTQHRHRPRHPSPASCDQPSRYRAQHPPCVLRYRARHPFLCPLRVPSSLGVPAVTPPPPVSQSLFLTSSTQTCRALVSLGMAGTAMGPK